LLAVEREGQVCLTISYAAGGADVEGGWRHAALQLADAVVEAAADESGLLSSQASGQTVLTVLKPVDGLYTDYARPALLAPGAPAHAATFGGGTTMAAGLRLQLGWSWGEGSPGRVCHEGIIFTCTC
jgi:hypothetical protein